MRRGRFCVRREIFWSKRQPANSEQSPPLQGNGSMRSIQAGTAMGMANKVCSNPHCRSRVRRLFTPLFFSLVRGAGLDARAQARSEPEQKITKHYLTRRHETRRRAASSLGMPESVVSGKSTETVECAARAARTLLRPQGDFLE